MRASNPEYETAGARRQNYEVFKPELERALAKRTAAEWCERLQAKGVPCGAVADLQAAVDNEQLAHRRMYPTTEDGTFVVGNSVKLSDYPLQPVRPYVAEKGEHTEVVLAELARNGKL